MKIIRKENIGSWILRRIRKGAIFIYPTDTIYGIGCNAMNFDSVERICNIKERYNKPFSVIAPSKKWIAENCEVNDKKILDNLPGAYTLVLKLRNKKCISKNVNNNLNTLGVRIPDHWIKNIVEKLNIPIITTSVNKTSKKFMTSLNDMDKNIFNKIDFIIYNGEIRGIPSQIIDLSKEKISARKR